MLAFLCRPVVAKRPGIETFNGAKRPGGANWQSSVTFCYLSPAGQFPSHLGHFPPPAVKAKICKLALTS